MKCAILAISAVLGPFTVLAPQQDDPPGKREFEQLLDTYVTLDLKTKAGYDESRTVLARLESVPWPRRESDLGKWQKRLDKARSKGRTLEKKGGMKWYWDDKKEGRRGKFYVGGNTKKPKGLFIGLHGGGAGSGEASSSHGAYSSPIREHDWVGIFPEVLAKTEHGWTDTGTEEWVMQLVDDALRTWKIDPQHVYLGGHSMGGYGTWVYGAHHADRWAALIASAGAPTPITGPSGKYEDVMEGVVPNLRNTRLCVFQSIDDPQVPPEANQAANAAVLRAKEKWGGYEQFEYWEVDGKGHGYPDGGMPALLAKIADHERDPHPTKLVWQPAKEWKRQFYWLYWDDPKIHSIVVAEIDRAANTIEVELTGTKGAGLSLLLSDAIVDMDKELTVFVTGKEVFKGTPTRSVATFVMTAAGGDPGRTYHARVPLH